MQSFYKNGVKFSCTQCHACCRGEPGVVLLSSSDIKNLCAFLDLTTDSFIKKYTRPIFHAGRPLISLIEKSNNDCIFWNAGCTVYTVRPLQCSTYPFWNRLMTDEHAWQRERQNCPGIDHGTTHSPDFIREQLQRREEEPYAFWDDYKEVE